MIRTVRHQRMGAAHAGSPFPVFTADPATLNTTAAQTAVNILTNNPNPVYTPPASITAPATTAATASDFVSTLESPATWPWYYWLAAAGVGYIVLKK